MYPFDTVLVKLVDNQPDIISGDNLIAVLRETVKIFDDQTSERVIVLGSKFRMKMIVDIVKAHGTLYNVFPIGNLLDKFILVLVVFVVDLTDDLLKDILQGDETPRYSR